MFFKPRILFALTPIPVRAPQLLLPRVQNSAENSSPVAASLANLLVDASLPLAWPGMAPMLSEANPECRRPPAKLKEREAKGEARAHGAPLLLFSPTSS